MNSRIKEAFAEHRVIFILRCSSPEPVIDMAETIWGAGGRFVEVTLNTPGAAKVLSGLSRRVPAGCYLGAGTVCSAEQVRIAADAGVSYVVSPVASMELAGEVRNSGLMGILGASTPTEVYNAHSWGADYVKVFPAQSPEYIRTLLGPFKGVSLIAVGGIRTENAQRYLRAGCAGVAVGASFFDLCSEGAAAPAELKAAVTSLVRVCELSRAVV
jgi:2-dehydro-3-deoxyphosphogluconate aldolase/(4S)-4-hydroxy-2-oxoglutarate aldolase